MQPDKKESLRRIAAEILVPAAPAHPAAILPVDHARTGQHFAVIPRGELPGRYAALGFVEKQIAPFIAHDQLRILQRLPVADPSPIAPPLPRLQALRRIDPVQFIPFHEQRPAIQPRMRIALAHIDHILSDIRRQYEKRLLAAADTEPLALTDRIEMGPVVFADLLAVRMTGPNRSAEMDPTFAASWGIYDPETKDWKQKAVRALGIPPALLPAVKPSGSIAGWTQHVPGLPDGVPLLLPLGDNQASIFATAEDPDRELFLTIGTGAQLSCTTDGRIPLPRCTELRPYLRGQQLATTAPLCGGRAWAWLGDTVNAMLKELGLPPFPEKELLNRLDEMAFRAEKTSTLTVSPHFLGERNAPSLRGSIEGITLNNLTLPNLAAGLARGIIRQLAEGIPDGLRNGRERIIGSGNGLRLCRFLQQAVEEEFHLPLLFRDLREEAATGAARLAAETLDSPVR